MKSADGPSLCSVDFVRGLLHALATALHSGSKAYLRPCIDLRLRSIQKSGSIEEIDHVLNHDHFISWQSAAAKKMNDK